MTTETNIDDATTQERITSLLEEGNKAFALRDYELSVEKYGQATELLGELHGESSPKCADALFLYGKALLENAVSQSGVLGSGPGIAADEIEEEVADDADPAKFHFGDEGEGGEEEDEAQAEEGNDDQDGNGNGEGPEEEPEDDFQTAWDVLDLARVLYSKTLEQDKGKQPDSSTSLKLADVYLSLGDVSLETENFDQAVRDYTSALELKTRFLSDDSRQLAEAHWKLALVLEYASGQGSENRDMAITHVRNAMAVLKRRISKISDEREKKDAKELLSEMEPKIQELQMPIVDAETINKVLEVAKGQGSAGPVNNIQTLVKKRKTEDKTEEEANKRR